MKKIFSLMSICLLINVNAFANASNLNENIYEHSADRKKKFYFYCTGKLCSVIIKK